MYKSIKWSFIIISALCISFTLMTLTGNNKYINDSQATSTNAYQIDITGVSDKERVKKQLEIVVDKARLQKDRQELENRTKEIKKREASLQ